MSSTCCCARSSLLWVSRPPALTDASSRSKLEMVSWLQHVDDILLVSPNVQLRSWFETQLAKSLEIVKQHGKHLSYLGMNIIYVKDKQRVEVSQSGAIRELVKKHGYDNLRKYPATRATPDIFKENADSPPCDKKEFLSLVMSMMYIARLTRSDILMPVTALATRSANPNQADNVHLRRVVRCLAGTPDVCIVFDGSQPIKPVIYADASHGVYPNARGHGGIFITLGSAPILSRSFKIKAVTRSSSESELYVLEEASTYAGWLILLLSELAVELDEPIATCQDNMSTMIIALQGGNFKRTKHLLGPGIIHQGIRHCADSPGHRRHAHEAPLRAQVEPPHGGCWHEQIMKKERRAKCS